MKGKKGSEWWHLVGIILAVVVLLIIIGIIAYTKSEIGKFTGWLQWLS